MHFPINFVKAQGTCANCSKTNAGNRQRELDVFSQRMANVARQRPKDDCPLHDGPVAYGAPKKGSGEEGWKEVRKGVPVWHRGR